MTPAKILRDAARVVLERGLLKGSFEDHGGRVCLLGAVLVAEVGAAWWTEYMPQVYKIYLENQAHCWSDLPETTAEDVASLLMSEAEVVDE